MNRLCLTFSIALLAGCATQQGGLSIKEMGSFHVGGREVTLSGLPVKEVLFTAGGVPAKIDPNGVYQVEQMYVQYLYPVNSAVNCLFSCGTEVV